MTAFAERMPILAMRNASQPADLDVAVRWRRVGGCTVRLLGRQGTASFVWAKCDARDSSYSTSMPLRVIGPKITKPVDDAGFSDSVRKMFPQDLADYVVANQDSPSLRP